MKKILNPFSYFTDKTLIILGLLGTFLGLMLGFYFHGDCDGAFDLHFVEKISWSTVVKNNVVSVLAIMISLSILGKIINPKTRLIDVLLTILIARIPLYLLNFINFNENSYHISKKIIESVSKIKLNPKALFQVLENDSMFFATSILFSVMALILSITLLFNGFKVATNLKKSSHIFYFVMALLVAEIISKTIILNIF